MAHVTAAAVEPEIEFTDIALASGIRLHYAQQGRTLVIGGARDAVFSVGEQAALAQQYPAGGLRLFDDAGHAPHWEQPEAFVRALLHFVR